MSGAPSSQRTVATYGYFLLSHCTHVAWPPHDEMMPKASFAFALPARG